MASKSTDRQSASRQKKPLPEIPDKLYYRIGEVARLCAVETYVLRFWETEFPQLKPNKSGAGQRLYRRREVELARRIRSLLYDDGYTIPGARHAIQGAARGEPHKTGEDISSGKAPQSIPETGSNAQELPLARAGLDAGQQTPRLGRLRTELKEILGMLSTGSAAKKAKPERASTAKRDAARPDLFD